MKKLFLFLLLFGVLLSSCVPLGSATDSTPTEEESETDESTRLAYYEQLAKELQQELLELKSELYVSRVEYESRIAELEPATKGESTPPPLETAFTYIPCDGGIEISGYIGSSSKLVIPSFLDGQRVVSIGESAFADLKELTAVTLPATVQTVGWFAFSGCSMLTDVSVTSSVKSIGYGAFDGCAENLTLHCPADCYAYQYAISYGMRTEDDQL